MDKTGKELVAALKQYLKKTKIPQYELASIIGCPPVNLNRWLKGKCAPSLSWRRLISSNERLMELLNG